MTKITTIAAMMMLLGSTPALAHAEDTTRRISVRGDAEIRVPPDNIVLSLGVETIDPELRVSRSKNDAASTAVIDALANLGINRSHIQTEYVNISITSTYKYDEKLKRQVGVRKYMSRKTITVELSTVEKFEEILSAAIEAGATHVHSIQFRTFKLREYRDQARSTAIKAAKDKAEALAKELGQKVGDPLTIGEGYSRWWSWYGSWWGSGQYNAMSQNVSQVSAPSEGTGMSIAPGQIAVTAQISVTFEMLPATP
jgi:uncharacterized protein